MKFRFTIGKKIGLGFGILIILTMIVFVSTYVTIGDSKKINDKIASVNTPSIKALQELKTGILETKIYLTSWVNYQVSEHPDKFALLEYRKKDYPIIKKELESLSEKWSQEQKDSLVILFSNIDYLFEMQNEFVIYTLNDFEDYDDFFNKSFADNAVEVGGEVYTANESVLSDLNWLISNQQKDAVRLKEDMLSSYKTLTAMVIYLGGTLIIFGILIAWYTTRSIVNPIRKLKAIAVKLGRGVFPRSRMKEGVDEIGEMTAAMNNVVDGLKRTKDFAQAVGSGNFETVYKPLSSKDTLGKALLRMRDDLAENERMLEEKVRLRTAEVVAQKEEIDKQRSQIEEYFVQVTDSIKYAQKIQEAILPPDHQVRRMLPNSFILYRPKDIVSGDFYWLGEANNKVFFAAVDCTGHGVPGAFMSIVGYNQLKQAIITTGGSNPAEILDHLNRGVSETLHQKDVNSTNKDGMDIAICSLNYETLELEYAGAFNPLYLLRNDDIIQVKGNKFPIGSFVDEEPDNFTNHTIQLEKGDQIYIFSDGYADQFGGPRGKKMMYRRFRDTLLENSKKDLPEQKQALQEFLFDWMKDEEQVDDILVMGVKV